MCTNRNCCGKNKIDIINGQSEKRVFLIEDDEKTNLSLHKMDFAEAIYTERNKMSNIDFSKFHLILDIIKQINVICMNTNYIFYYP